MHWLICLLVFLGASPVFGQSLKASIGAQSVNPGDHGDIVITGTGPDQGMEIDLDTIIPDNMADGSHGGFFYLNNIATITSVQSGSAFPASPLDGDMVWLTNDCASGQGECSIGTNQSWCRYNATLGQWQCIGSDYIRNVMEDCAGQTEGGKWCKDFAGNIYQGDGTSAICVNCGGGSAAPGSDTQMIYNNAGNFGAVTGVTLNSTTSTVTAQGGFVAPCDVSLTDCYNTFPNETADIPQPGATGSCNWIFVNGVQQQFCNPGTLQHVATLETAQTFTTTQTFSGGKRQVPIAPNSSPYTMTEAACGTSITNTNMAGPLVVNLVADPSGCTVCFWATVAQPISANPDGTDIIAVSGLPPPGLAAGDQVQLPGAIANHWCIQGENTTKWLGYPGVGTLVDAGP